MTLASAVLLAGLVPSAAPDDDEFRLPTERRPADESAAEPVWASTRQRAIRASSGPESTEFVPVSLRWSWLPATEGSAVSMHRLEVGLSYPLLFHGQETVIINGLQYGMWRTDGRAWPGPFLPSTFHHITYELLVLQELSPAWTLLVGLAPGYYSDFEHVYKKALRATGLVLVDYQVTPRVSLSFGMVYADNLGTATPLPAFGVEWQASPRWHLSFAFPDNLVLTYRVDERLTLSLGARTEGASFRGTTSRARLDRPRLGESGATDAPTEVRHTVAYSLFTVGPRMRWGIGERVFLILETGLLLERIASVSDIGYHDRFGQQSYRVKASAREYRFDNLADDLSWHAGLGVELGW